MRLSTIMISLLICGALTTGFYLIVSDFSGEDAYNVAYDDNYEKTYNRTLSRIGDINDDFDNVSSWRGSKDTTLGFITFTIDALSLVKTMLTLPMDIFKDTVDAFQQDLSLPKWVGGVMRAIITLVLIFSFISLVLRYRDT